MPLELDALDFEKGGGLVAVVAQEAHTGEVLMLAHANREAVELTLSSGELWLWSRSRSRLWKKGETSGNVLKVVGLAPDCDGDALLARVEPAGPACHTGNRSCFMAPPPLAALEVVLAQRAAVAPAGSYTARLLSDTNLRLKKLGEEAAELVLACAKDDAEAATAEAADLIYHALVACLALGVSANQVFEELGERLQ